MTATNDPIVLVQSLSLTYRSGFLGRRRLAALRDVDLRVDAGTLVGVVGPNGSGKSSLFRCLLGLEHPLAKQLAVHGKRPGARRSLVHLGYVSEGRLPLGRLTAREFLTLTGAIANRRPGDARARADTLLERVGLSQARDRAHAEFSTGMERRLAFANALFHEPQLLILDEPSSGMDPLGIEMVRTELIAHTARGGTAIVATHSLEALGPETFDELCVLLDGRVVTHGHPSEVLGIAGTRELRLTSVGEAAMPKIQRAIEALGGRVESDGPALRSLGSLLAEVQRRTKSSL